VRGSVRGPGVGLGTGSVLATTGLLEGGGLEESHDFCLLCADLHAISYTPFLTDM